MKNYMKNKKRLTTIIVGIMCINLIALLSLTTEVNDIKGVDINMSTNVKPNDSISEKDKAKIEYYQALVDSIEYCVQSNFDYSFPKFKKYNENIDSGTVRLFSGIINAYGLDNTTKYREMYVGQILLESGATHYKPNGDVLIGSNGAIGFCQIVPNTCLGYLQNNADTTDIKIMRMLGATEFIFAFEDGLTKKQRLIKTKKWLSNVSNNIIMWAFITKYNLDKKGNIHTQLVSYNMGDGGIKTFMSAGGDVTKHHYIKDIEAKLSEFN